MAIGHCVIFDLDNCLANDAWRIPRIAWHVPNPDLRYQTYHALSPFDEAANTDLVHAWARQGCSILISTARPSWMRAATLEWMRRKVRLNPVALFMREHGDHRPSAVLKEEHLERGLAWCLDRDGLLHAYDDRPDVIAMYRANNIHATQLSIHSVCAYTAPTTQRSTPK